MKREDIRLPSKAAGRTIHTVIWEPEEEPRAVLQIAHGMGEYIGRYEPFAVFLCGRGIAVVGHDHLGHGESIRVEDDRGFFADENGDAVVIQDMKTVTLEAKRRYPGLPVFLLGHSMGSFFARRYLAAAGGELAGAIVAGTGWVPVSVASVGLRIARTVCRTKGDRSLSPTLDHLVLGGSMKAFPAEGRMAWLSTDPATTAAYEADPLCGIPFTAGAYRDFFAVMKSVARGEDFDGIRRTLPILIVSGERDPVGGKQAVEKVAALYRKLDFADVTEKVFPGDRHEILNEKDRAEVYRFLAEWIEKRIRK
jgi:alpha-beta hydrolase superfamily lysophospholipase